MLGRTNASFGGGAKITVTVEAGSEVTCTNGNVTKQATSQGVVVFSGLSVGLWTITATKNGRTAMQTVEIANPEISMAYELTLYDNGDITDATGGWEVKTFSGYQISEVTSTGVANVKAQNGGTGVYVTKKEFDVSGFSKLQYKVGNGGTGTLSVVLIPASATSLDAVVASKQITTATPNPAKIEEWDISSITGKYQIGLGMMTASGQILNGYMAYMHLE